MNRRIVSKLSAFLKKGEKGGTARSQEGEGCLTKVAASTGGSKDLKQGKRLQKKSHA